LKRKPSKSPRQPLSGRPPKGGASFKNPHGPFAKKSSTASSGRYPLSQTAYLPKGGVRVEIPERIAIAEVVSAKPGITSTKLARALEIEVNALDAFSRRLRAMLRDGDLTHQGDALFVSDGPKASAGTHAGAGASANEAEIGVVSRHRDGFGFLAPAGGGGDLFVPPPALDGVMHGDTVSFTRRGFDRRGKQEARITGIVERAVKQVVARLKRDGVRFSAVPADKRFTDTITLIKKPEGIAPGSMVVVKITRYPTQGYGLEGEITEVLGDEDDAGIEIEIALRKHDLPHEFSASAMAEAERIPATVQDKDVSGRLDLRKLPLVTIDGEDARDFDDAVYCEPKTSGGFRLIVAIADVSHYVKPSAPLDVDALERGTSVYFPRRVIPMLPEKLSNGLCSLNPEVDRLVMACDMHVSDEGEIESFEFHNAVMHSNARFTYTEVAAILAAPAQAAAQRKKLVPHLLALEQVFRTLLKARARRGAVDFDSTETKMVFNENGRIERIVPVTRNDAHRLIEECMLAANVCAATFLETHKHPALFRIHAGPTPEKLATLREFLGALGLLMGGGDAPQATDYAKLSTSIKERPDAGLIQTMLLRSMQQAQYSPDNIGHFGLSYERYAHFTSPIRRYPDLLVHRAIKAVLKHSKMKGDDWDGLGAHCSQTERRADDASREVQSWLKCMYAREHIGVEMEGSISGLANFGLFVTLDNLLIDGMIHVSELGRDYFIYDEKHHVLRGRSSGQSFRLGQRLKVKIVRADPDALKIDLMLLGPADGKPKKQAEEAQSSPVLAASPSTVAEDVKTAKPPHKKSGTKPDSKPRNQRSAPSTPVPTKPIAKKASVKKSAPEPASKPAPKQAAPEKVLSKKSATKKSAPKKPASKAPALKKSVVKKSVLKKPTSKKPALKKLSSKKSTSTKLATKKPIAKKKS
jgi:ribonuclease R